MSYYLILDADYQRRGQNVDIVDSSDDITTLIKERSYLPDNRGNIDTPDLSFVMSHDLIDSSVRVPTSVPAAIYQA